ncbi:hypothetical protein HII31_00131 [Pseudocercospora fuligena]|uniref:CDAN1-interacting nuclease 1 n=1 Tax=Pseudocercospora fuligena TaxID=685502 RepID=A0A8H6RVW1_9PEZI|nr:hypothetical protein HII31_00131 [Pseudocercospora fuligena]
MVLGASNVTAYNGIDASEVKILWRMALALRFNNPKAKDVIYATGTRVSEDVVAAILEGALRLLPVLNSPNETAIRQRMMRVKQEEALDAERSFVEHVRTQFPLVKDESEQKKAIQSAIEQGQVDVVRATPDILFATPERLCGVECCWIEYKNMFGFRKNPFVHSKHLKQY